MFFPRFLNYIVENLTKVVRYHKAVAELNNLSDRELNDIGITRGEILTTVYFSSLKEMAERIPSRAF